MGEQRKYSVAEIDAMRVDVERLSTWYSTIDCEPYTVNGARRIEDRLRTYMTAGVDPADLAAMAAAHMAEQHAIRRDREEFLRKKAPGLTDAQADEIIAHLDKLEDPPEAPTPLEDVPAVSGRVAGYVFVGAVVTVIVWALQRYGYF